MSLLIDQEAWLAYFAERLGVDTTALGERDLRLALALYHGAYLPTAATVELRANELDLKQRYAEFGFTPNTPTFATAKVKVVLRNAALSTYSLAAPFTVRQGDLTFTATEPLVVPSGQTQGTAAIVAQMQGAAGTPQENAAASIGPSVAWLRGAAITIVDVVEGQDGGTTEEIQAAFRAFAFNPQALVRAEDHATYVETEFPFIGRAYAYPRTKIEVTGGVYSATTNTAGNLSIALVAANGGQPSDDQVNAIKTALLAVTVPYGSATLHVVKAVPKTVSGSVSAIAEPGADPAEVKALVAEALNDFVDWRTWPAGRDVHAGDMWAVIDTVPGVRYVTDVVLDNADDEVISLDPWEYPVGDFEPADITLS